MKHPKHQQGGGALPFEDQSPPETKSVFLVSESKLNENPGRPRTVTSTTATDELVESVRQRGILQPILARQEKDGTFTIIKGHRRAAAAFKAGLKVVPVVTREDVTPLELSELALAATVQRENLHPVDLLFALERLYQSSGTWEAVADRLGWSHPKIKKIAVCLNIDKAELEARRTDPKCTMKDLRRLQEEKYQPNTKPAKSDVPALWAASLEAVNNSPLGDFLNRRQPSPTEPPDRMATVGTAFQNAALTATETTPEPRQPQTHRITQEQIDAIERAKRGETEPQPDPAEAKGNVLDMPPRKEEAKIRKPVHKVITLNYKPNIRIHVEFDQEEDFSAQELYQACQYAADATRKNAENAAGKGVRAPEPQPEPGLKKYRKDRAS